jgi:lipopolysaccharide/colanic/teichoic acid biosynthesis glycosyltransferase
MTTFNHINKINERLNFLPEAVKHYEYRLPDKKYYSKIKKPLDKVFAFIGIIILSPFYIIIALSIRVTSKGPVIFKQYRVGKDGKLFEFYKFRTMEVFDEEDHLRKDQMINFMKEQKSGRINKKVINSNRVTSVGKILRKTSLDELPQLFNVIKGDMSMVGPRPCMIYEYENYEQWYKKRHMVLPGCTGIWQVLGRGKVSFSETMIMDIFYTNNFSFLLDIGIIVRTIPVIILGIGGE